jgi:hypothetical protein
VAPAQTDACGMSTRPKLRPVWCVWQVPTANRGSISRATNICERAARWTWCIHLEDLVVHRPHSHILRFECVDMRKRFTRRNSSCLDRHPCDERHVPMPGRCACSVGQCDSQALCAVLPPSGRLAFRLCPRAVSCAETSAAGRGTTRAFVLRSRFLLYIFRKSKTSWE